MFRHTNEGARPSHNQFWRRPLALQCLTKRMNDRTLVMVMVNGIARAAVPRAFLKDAFSTRRN